MIARLNLQNGITVGAFVLSLVLLAVNIWMVSIAIDTSPDEAVLTGKETANSSPVSKNESSARPLQVTETVARPLFNPTRRGFVAPIIAAEPEPVKPQIVEVEPVPVAKPALVFQGTSRIGGRSAALIAHEDGSNADWRTTGQDIMGWKIETIEPDRLVISLNSQQVVYELYPKTGTEGQQ